MKVFFSKAAIMIVDFFNFTKPNSDNEKNWKIGYRIVLILLALALFVVFLRKIYEVPVNYTEIQVLHKGSMNSGDLHCFIIRDYDRHRESSDNILRKDTIRRGGIFVEGVLCGKDSPGTIHSTWFANDSSVNKNIEIILDTAHFDYKNNVSDVVYTMILTTTRQRFKRLNTDSEISFELKKTRWFEKSAFYHYGIFKSKRIESKYCVRNKWNVPVDTLFIYNRLRQNYIGGCYESFEFATKDSEAVPVFNEVCGSNFEKPNPFTVAEDVSKIFEIIRIPVASAQFVNSITIDYRCPTEFGHLDPEPDVMTYSAIRYFDRDKIDKIAWDGLKFHAKFPDMENIQEIRIFALTTIITLLITFLLSLLYKLFSKYILRVWSKHTRLLFFTLLIVVAITTISIILFESYTRVNYSELKFDTLGNEREWEHYDY